MNETQHPPAIPAAEEGSGPRRFPRRPLLAVLVAGSGAAVAGAATDTGLIGGLLGLLTPNAAGASPISLLAARPDDGLLVTLSFVNLDVVTGGGNPPRLAVHDQAADGLVVLGLGPQSLLEEAFPDSGTGPRTPNQPIGALLAGPSRIVLRIPGGSAPVPYDLPTLLDLARYPLSVSPFAQGTSPSGPAAAPAPTETAIEAPYRLFLSPQGDALFSAARTPVTRNGRTELWHARVVPRLGDGSAGQKPAQLPVRAIWSPDVAAKLTAPDWAVDRRRVSLTPQNRIDIVRKTTTEQPAHASLMLVSPMGASLDLDATWTSADLIGWRHRSWLGRDNYVKVVDHGYLFPFGFPAELITVTERVIQDGIAFQRLRQFVVVRQAVVGYRQDQGPQSTNPQPSDGRKQPFTRATTSTIVSPPLDKDLVPGAFVTVLGQGGQSTPLRYQLTLTTKDTRTVTSELPLIWVNDSSNNAGRLATLVNAYADTTKTDPALRTLALGGQRVGFVPSATGVDHSLATTEIRLSGDTAARPVAATELGAFPVLEQAQVRVEELDALGGPQGSTTPLYYDPSVYLPGGFGDINPKNTGDAWAVLKPAPTVPSAKAAPPDPLKFALSQASGGGMAAPQFAVDALSRIHGTVTDLRNIADNNFDPRAYFTDDNLIKLFGAIPLSQIVQVDQLGTPSLPEGENIPKITTKRTGDTVETTVTWNAKLISFTAPGDLFTFDPGPGERLHLTLKLTAARDGRTSSVVTGELSNADLTFLDMIVQPIKRLRFESHNGAKPHIDLKLGTPRFAGDLRFLANLQQFLPALPGGVTIKQTPTGVQAGLSLAVPSVPMGVVLVQNLAVGVLFDLPFDGSTAKLSFSFCTRDHPFHLTVMALGGGGYLTIGLPMNGQPPAIEGALEFGAAVAIDLGVASGSVSIMAGIYLAFGPKTNADNTSGGNTVVITGYVRAVGELSVLGLIHVSLEFYLGLTFAKVGGHGVVRGEATLKVRVEVFLFSTTVSVSMRKEIGAGADPSFGDQISAADWSAHCAAFA